MKISIASSEIGNSEKVFIIAEGCDNHLGDLDTAKKMAYEAKIAGADAIKFQHHIPDEEMLPNVPISDNFDEPLYEFLKKYALNLEQHKELKRYCDQINIIYMCTPFSWKAAQEIEPLVEAFKIGSGEMTDIPTLLRISKFGKPMIISTGMCTFDEIERTYKALIVKNKNLVLMNCLSEYPPIYEDLNLKVITEMKEKFPNAIIGHSDHTPDIYTSFAAVTLGAKVIEKHVILDKKQPGPDQSVSIEFSELAKLVEGIRKIEVSLGNKKRINSAEAKIREWAFRSIVSIDNINKGDLFTEENIWSKRPGTGIPSYKMDEILGCIALRDIEKNSLIKPEDVKRG